MFVTSWTVQTTSRSCGKRKARTQLRRSLRRRGLIERFVAHFGEIFEAGPFSSSYPAAEPGHCLAGTRRALQFFHELRPVVGYAVPPGESRALPHVWAIDPARGVVDCSWQNRGGLYLGVVVTPGQLSLLWSERD
jgi:hypothetical protein